MTKFGTHMRIDLGMVPTKNLPHEWPGSVGSLGPISESGLSCQLLLRAVVWQMTSQLIRRRNDVVFAAFNMLQSTSVSETHECPVLLALGGCSWPSLMHEVTDDFLVVHIKASQKSLGDKPKSVHIFLQTPREVYTRKS